MRDEIRDDRISCGFIVLARDCNCELEPDMIRRLKTNTTRKKSRSSIKSVRMSFGRQMSLNSFFFGQ